MIVVLNAAINLNNDCLDTLKPDVKCISESGKTVDLSTARLSIVVNSSSQIALIMLVIIRSLGAVES